MRLESDLRIELLHRFTGGVDLEPSPRLELKGELVSKQATDRFLLEPSGVNAFDASELDQVAHRIAAEEARPIGDRGVVEWFSARGLEKPPGFLKVFDVETEVARRGGIGGSDKEVQFEARAGMKPNQRQMRKRFRRCELGQAEHISVEMPDETLFPLAKRGRHVLKLAKSH